MSGQSAADGSPLIGDGVQIAVAPVKTPFGTLRIASSRDCVLAVELPRQQSGAPVFDEWLRDHLLARTRPAVLRQAILELREYFGGKRHRFAVPLAPSGTEFQQRVWRAVAAIPFGQTTTYGAIAAGLGDKQRARAVGAAVGANPIPIFIPCHRVLGTNDALTGYGGGLKMKVRLLRHEGVLLA
ncbi:MAG TPA: methylated-DNA--[protein]-cysteine S-methyltransferase [Candidatus Acidoferrales bacterium]|nr:methylated-DNA--[protein]-cysteine S-methyltransferase [Candidatus Acidoferrales bacterium]